MRIDRLKIKVTPHQASALMGIENELLNRLNGLKFVSNDENVRMMQKMIDLEVFEILNRLERIATSHNPKILNLTYTQCVCLYYALRSYPIHQVDVFLSIVINEFLRELHQHLF